jgi:pimeloyl-ACP methyl ester carboxylesterase
MATAAPLLFLPGAGADPLFWRPAGDLLPAAFAKTYLGWPGLAGQRADPAVRSFADLVALAEGHLGDAPVNVLAQSMGGVIAMHLALRHPAKVRRLVLTATSGGIDAMRDVAYDWRPEMRRQFPQGANWMMTERRDLTAELPRVRCPVLLLWGDRDRISPLAVGERLHELLPRSTLHVVRGGDHDFVRTHAAEVARLIERHLA